MTLGKPLSVLTLFVSLFLQACSSGGGGGSAAGTLNAVSQDLGLDPTGQTTVVTFSRAVPTTLTPGNFVADAGQLATSVVVSGATATVTWDSRVTPSHQVEAVGISGITEAFVAVTSTDPSAPTFTISAGTQTVGLGGDTFTVQFSGPQVVEATAEDIANWDLSIGGTSLDLTGSTFTFDAATQSVAVVLGTSANLHANFDLSAPGVMSVADTPVAVQVAGTASGDSTAPSLVSAQQNLAESEFGFVVDFTFDEAMDPALNPLAGFDAGLPIFATQFEQPSPEVLRVTFTGPVIPGQDTVTLTGIIDAHGNAFPTGSTAIAAPTTVANAYSGSGPVVSTVENVGGDTIVATFVQALDPDAAALPASWSFESPTGTSVDLTNANFDYDLMAKSLTITLTDTDLATSSTFQLAPSGTPALDVDGEAFASTATGTVGGDVTGPAVTSATQNRVLDPSGLTFEVLLSEDVDEVQAETTSNYTVSSGANVTSATLLNDGNTVRLVLDTQTLPGQHTIDVANLVDIAGNTMTPVAGQALVSTDTNAPLSISEEVYAEVGYDNDTVTIVFDDTMVASEVSDPDNWVFQSPTGTFLDTSNASVVWTAATKSAVLTFDGGDGINLKSGDTFTVSFVTMRDIAGNTVPSTSYSGTVSAETGFPSLESVWVETADPTQLHIRFDEPVELFSDALTSYVIRDAAGLDIGGGPPTVTPDADGMGATLGWAVGAVAGTHTLDVQGITDLAGNQMFPALLHPIEAEVGTAPSLDAGISDYVAVSGENNDVLTIVFDQPVSAWQLLDPANYTLTDGGTSADFTQATLSFDGTDTVTATFDQPGSFFFDNGAYTLDVSGVLSAQGMPMVGTSSDTANAAAGTDATAPQPVSGQTRLDAADPTNSVLIELDEALDSMQAVVAANYAISGVNPDSVQILGPRTVRATFSGGVSAGQTVDITAVDLAGNSGLVSEAIQVADTAGPAVIGVAGVVAPGTGGDVVRVTFSEPVSQTNALNPSNYTVSAGGVPIDVSSSNPAYESATNTVTIPLPVDLLESDTINVMVSGVSNLAGITMSSPANVNGSISGDGVAPGFVASYVNFRADPGGATVDILFDEDVDESFVTDPLQYTVVGGQQVLSATMIRADTVRLTLSFGVSSGDMISLTALPDLAGNVSGTITTTPTL